MDKFGIFNLLNGFLGQNNKSSSDINPFATNENTGNNSSSGGVLQNLLSLLNGNKATSTEQNKTEKKNEVINVKTIPLQDGMLKTMTSHEQFIKRVQSKNKN